MRTVGPIGTIRALKIAPKMPKYPDLRVRSRKIHNIRLHKVLNEDHQLKPASVETIPMIDTIHHAKDRVA